MAEENAVIQAIYDGLPHEPFPLLQAKSHISQLEAENEQLKQSLAVWVAANQSLNRELFQALTRCQQYEGFVMSQQRVILHLVDRLKVSKLWSCRWKETAKFWKGRAIDHSSNYWRLVSFQLEENSKKGD